MQNEDQFPTPHERENQLNKVDEQTDNEANRTANDHVESGQEGADSLSTQGDYEEVKDSLGGGTNLSLDQLKEDDGQPSEEDEA
jgi:hypothetical protein